MKKIFTSFLILTLFSLSISAQNRGVAYELQNTFREVSSKVLPVVVEVTTVSVVEGRNINPFDFFFRFPGQPNEDQNPESRPFRSSGLGSGVIVEKRNNTVYVLTNNHVVERTDEITLNLHDGRSFKGELVGGDSLRDLALVSFETREDVPVAVLGNSDQTFVGDWVLAVGNPLGFESTVTSGIISAKGRYAQNQSFTDYLQTDASINQGNSGGALVNLEGEVIGINTFIASTSGGNIGLGFAIPINNARKAINDFITKGNIEYAWLGVNMGDLNEMIIDELDLDIEEGTIVYNIYGDSPAMRSDLRPGDVIVRVGNQDIRAADDLTRAIASRDPGDRISVRVIRDGNPLNVSIVLDVRTIERDGLKVSVWPGFSVVPLTNEIREQMKIPRNAGKILIGPVVEDSPAQVLGLRNGDVIKSINRSNVRNVKHFYELVNENRRIEIKIFRQGHELEFILNKN